MRVLVALAILGVLGLPLAEIAVFILVGGAIGVWPTLALVIAAALLGAFLTRREGLATARAAMRSLDAGEIPVREAVSGAVLVFAGACLVFPGFITDMLGFLLLLRPVRLWIGARFVTAFLDVRKPPRDGRVIEGKSVRLPDGY